jgi:tRNA(Ile)-lysidine synthase
LSQQELRKLHVGGRGDLDVPGRAHHHPNAFAQPLDQGCLVGAGEAVFSRAGKGALDQLITEALWRLGLHHPFARNGRCDQRAVRSALHLLNRIDSGQSGNGCSVLLHLMNDARDNVIIHKRAHRIVYQHNIVRSRAQASQGIGYRILAVFTTFHQRDFRCDLFLFQPAAELLHLVLAQRNNNVRDLFVTSKDAQSVNENGRAVDLEKLFTGNTLSRRRHAGAKTGCRYDGDDLHQRPKYNNFARASFPARKEVTFRFVIEQLRKYILAERLLRPGDRVALAVSGGADSVALLRVLLQLREELGVVLSVAHFHHGIRGAEADADRQFVADLAVQFGLELHSGSGDAPAYAAEHGLSLETAARELRHRWFGTLLSQGKADKIATAHTLDDQAETVLMRMIRGSGARGLAGISSRHNEKGLIRPFLRTRRADIETYLRSLNQSWREDSSNKDLAHTRNRIRAQVLPSLERDFNPAIRQTLADLAEVARAEAEFWDREVAAILPRVLRPGKPSRSGRSSSGNASATWALDLAAMQSLPLAMQRQLLHRIAGKIGTCFEFKHIEELVKLAGEPKRGLRLALPGGFVASCTFRELQFSRDTEAASTPDYRHHLPIPGEVEVRALGATIRASVIRPDEKGLSGYNPALLLDRALLQPELIVRNWHAGDRYLPAHTQSPKKVKELLQTGRLGRPLVPAERQAWPVIESGGQIVWLRGFPVAEAFAYRAGDAVLIEEIKTISGAEQ